jgi:hypothetical protein
MTSKSLFVTYWGWIVSPPARDEEGTVSVAEPINRYFSKQKHPFDTPSQKARRASFRGYSFWYTKPNGLKSVILILQAKRLEEHPFFDTIWASSITGYLRASSGESQPKWQSSPKSIVSILQAKRLEEQQTRCSKAREGRGERGKYNSWQLSSRMDAALVNFSSAGSGPGIIVSQSLWYVIWPTWKESKFTRRIEIIDGIMIVLPICSASTCHHWTWKVNQSNFDWKGKTRKENSKREQWIDLISRFS